MRSEEARDLARLAGEAAAGIARTARRTQESVTEAVYDALDPALGTVTGPLRHVHRGMVRGVYGAVDLGLRGTAATAGFVVERRLAARDRAAEAAGSAPPSADPLASPSADLLAPPSADPPTRRPITATRLGDTVRGAVALGALNAFAGDRLLAGSSSLALPMRLRCAGRDVEVTTAGLRTAYGSGDRRLAVYVHGLVEDDLCWTHVPRRARRAAAGAQAATAPGASPGGAPGGDPRGSGVGTREPPADAEDASGRDLRPAAPATNLPWTLRHDRDLTPVAVRYNTGAPILGNGAELSALLDRLVTAWPGAVEELVLVGHSMGGCVIHAALAQGSSTWTARLTHVVTLGSPLEGAPLERLADAVCRGSATVPQLRWLSDIVGIRSRGIVDLGHAVGPLPYVVGPRYLEVYGTLAPWPHPLTDRLGDGLVPVPPGARRVGAPGPEAPGPGAPGPGATGLGTARGAAGGRPPAPPRDEPDCVERIVVGGLGHQGLLHDERVTAAVSAWLAGPEARVAGPRPGSA